MATSGGLQHHQYLRVVVGGFEAILVQSQPGLRRQDSEPELAETPI